MLLRKIRENKRTLILAALFLAVIIGVWIDNIPLEREVIASTFYVGNTSGLDLSPGMLTFGRVTPDGSSSRGIMIKNNFDESVIISIKSKGEIKKNIAVSDNNFILAPYEVRNITFTAYGNGIDDFRKYAGEVIITTRKV